MDIKGLKYFVAVVEAGSFARAATRLRIAQPALGWQIRKLEDELEAQLLVRHSRGIEPTVAGRRLLAHARSILARVQDAMAEVRSVCNELQGTVVLGMTPSVNSMLTLPLMKRLADDAPSIRIRPVEELSAVLTEWVANGRLDLAIGYPITALSGLVCEPLVGEPIYFIERAGPGAKTGETIPFLEAACHKLVLTVTSQRYREYLDRLAAAHGLKINIVHQMQSVATLRDLLVQGDAASILPLGVVTREVAAGTLTARRIIEPEINRELTLFRTASRPPTPAEQIICAMIRELVVDVMAESAGFWVPIQNDRGLAIRSAELELNPAMSSITVDENTAVRERSRSEGHGGKEYPAASFDQFLRD